MSVNGEIIKSDEIDELKIMRKAWKHVKKAYFQLRAIDSDQAIRMGTMANQICYDAHEKAINIAYETGIPLHKVWAVFRYGAKA